MSIEVLTEEERGWLVADPEYRMWDVRCKVIRIIDAHAAERAALVERAERAEANAEEWRASSVAEGKAKLKLRGELLRLLLRRDRQVVRLVNRAESAESALAEMTERAERAERAEGDVKLLTKALAAAQRDWERDVKRLTELAAAESANYLSTETLRINALDRAETAERALAEMTERAERAES